MKTCYGKYDLNFNLRIIIIIIIIVLSVESRKTMQVKREQEVQQLLFEKIAKKEPVSPNQEEAPFPIRQEQTSTSPEPQPIQNLISQTKPSLVAPQAKTVVAQAIESVMRSNMEEEQTPYREKLAAKGNGTSGM